MKKPRTLFLKATTFQQIWYMCNVKPLFDETEKLFIQCNKAGMVNWDKNSVYTEKELENRKHEIIC